MPINNKNLLIKPIAFSFVILIGSSLLYYIDVNHWLAILQTSVKITPIKGSLLFFITYIILSTLCCPISPFILLSGFLFGPLYGSIFSLLSSVISATLTFLIARYFLRGFICCYVEKKYPHLKKYEQHLQNKGTLIAIIARFLPIPFSMLNISFAMTSIRLQHFIIGSFIGMAPIISIVSNVGHNITNIKNTSFLISIALYLIFILIIVIIQWRKKQAL